tara:strand:+ start:478 stop:648 length:171 start_codon:yes stop_codon:yes gene_type:complete
MKKVNQNKVVTRTIGGKKVTGPYKYFSRKQISETYHDDDRQDSFNSISKALDLIGE